MREKEKGTSNCRVDASRERNKVKTNEQNKLHQINLAISKKLSTESKIIHSN